MENTLFLRSPQQIEPLVPLVETFLSGRNARTIQAYRQDLQDFQAFIGVENIQAGVAVILSRGHGQANGLALQYKGNLIQRGLHSATVNRRLAALRSVVRLARTLGMVPWVLEVENMKTQPYRDTRGPGRVAVRAMLNHLTDQEQRSGGVSLKAKRDRAIVLLLYSSGLRRGEVASLNVEDVDLDAGTLAVLGKGRTEKEWMTLPESTKTAIGAWLEVRGTGPGPLFSNMDRAGKGIGHLTGKGIWQIVRNLGRKVGVKSRPHGLRHSGITEAVKLAQINGIGLEEVLDFSRHANVKTLMVYRDRERNVQGQLAELVAGGIEDGN
jgi:integrase/recombinase XerC